MNELDVLQAQIGKLNDELHNNYGRLTPIQKTQIEINIYNLEIQVCRVKIDGIRRNRNIDYIDELEIQKQQLMIQYYEKSIQQCNEMLRRYH